MRGKFSVLIALLLVVSMIVVGCGQKESSTPPNNNQPDSNTVKTTDVIVVGGGLAGLSAAITAADNGASVVLVEKMGFVGGSSLLSGGGLLAAESHVQQREGMSQTKDELEVYWYEQQAMTQAPAGYPDKNFVRMIIDKAPDTIKFAEDNGVVFGRPSSFFPEVKDRLHFPAENGASGLIMPLSNSAKAKGVEILLETSALKLTTDSTGAVNGIIAKGKDGKEFTISGKSVILANGGFSRNPEMMGKVSPVSKSHISVAGVGTVGDGYRMAEEVGADFHNEDWIIGLRSQAVEGNSPLNGLVWTTGLYTTLEGNRFTNEGAPYSVLYNSTADQGIEEYFLIFDQKMAAAVEAGISQGVVFKGDTAEELAKASGMDAETLQGTIIRYNELANKGTDEDFGKSSEAMVPLQDGALYAMKVRVSQMGTMGGVRTTLNMEVLNKQGQIIPGLFAAGEMANRPFYGRVYVSGSALQIAATTGRIAAQSATK